MNSTIQIPTCPSRKPIVATLQDLTGVSDGEVSAVYNSNSMSIGLLESTAPITSQEELRKALIQLERVNSSTPSQQRARLTLPILTPAFGPLLDHGLRTSLSRLTLNIANACNLWCSYCYADHGNYHAPTSLMASDVAVQIITRSLKLYPEIRTIHFFGGEPLLNPAAIEAVCIFLRNERGDDCPEFVATTNGTVLDERLEQILQEYRIGLTISLDGPASIHDRLRPAKRGASSHAPIRRNVERLRALGINIEFECTYTMAHYRMGISVCDLLDYFADELGETRPHISWSYLPRPNPAFERAERVLGIFRDDLETQTRQHVPVGLASELFREAARKSMGSLGAGKGAVLSFVTGILERLTTKRRNVVYCPAFTSQMSISADGTAYPCFMFIGDPRMRLGNILDPGFPDKEAKAIWERYREGLGNRATGSDSWYAALISGCIAGDYISTGGFAERLYEPVQEAMAEEVILGLAHHINKQHLKGEANYGT